MDNQQNNSELQVAGAGQPPQPPPPPKPTYNPLMDNVNDKPYSVNSMSVGQEQMAQAIPEPQYQPQNLGGRENPYKTIREGGNPNMGSGPSNSQAGPPPINPSMNNIPEEDRKEGAKYVAKVIMDVYKQAHVWGNAALPINEKKLQKLEAEGKIDLSMELPDGNGGTTTPSMYIQEFNEQVKDALQVDPKWEKETMPILEKVLAKRGAAMTDEQMLMFQFGKDIGIKALQVIGIKKQQSQMIDLWIEYKTQYGSDAPPSPRPRRNDRKANDDTTTSPYAHVPETPTPPPPPRSMKQDTTRFNFENNEAVMQSSVSDMKVPSSGKARLMQQKAKEKKWKQDAENAGAAPSSYEQAMAQRKTGKRGRKKSVVDYVNAVDKEEIVDALILSETKNEKK